MTMPAGYFLESSSAFTLDREAFAYARSALQWLQGFAAASPRQFWVIWQKSRGSISFHLLVPGGK